MPGRLFPPPRCPPEGEVDLRAPLSAFGRYDLLEKIGEGAASEVFVARSDGFEGLFRSSALKRMKADLCSDVALVSRFIEEARLAVRVEHPGTVGVDDFGRVGGVYFIAYELVDGVSVEELIAKVTARGLMIDPRAAAFIMRAVAQAVHAVHKTKGADGKPLGLVHADLQPKNVLVSRDGKVKVRGFAAPSLFQSESAALFLEALGPVGIAHQAPEVLAGAMPTTRADVWSLGALAFELLTGEQLFAPTSRVEDLVNAVRTVPVAPPSSRFAGVPSVLDAIVDEALVRVPEKRGSDAGAWADALNDYLQGAGYDEEKFVRTLTDLDGDDARGSAPGRQSTKVQRFTKRSASPAPVDLASPSTQHATGVMPGPSGMPQRVATSRVHLVEQLHKDPGPWGLVRLAERTVDDGRAEDAKAMFRAAAIVFASRGLLAHALCAHDGARGALSHEENRLDLLRLSELGEGNLALRQTELRRVGGLAWLEALRAQTDGLDAPIANAPSTPFLSALPPEAFARLGMLARVRRAPAGGYVLREGEPGDSLFAVGEGRLVVTCTPSTIEPGEADVESDEREERTDPGIGARRLSGVVVAAGLENELGALARDDKTNRLELVDPSQSRVFLSALTAGDLFGEFSFLTGRPRSASVEAVTTCRLVEITRAAVGGLLDQHLELRDAIEAFYKERVLEWMLAKNEVFSLLEPEARRALLSQCGVYDIPAGKVVVREGELHDAMYFIKRGEVEVTTNDAGLEVFINKLGAGEFFGEIAALEGGPRRANVRAVTDLEVFRIARGDLQHVLADAPEVKAKLAKATKARSDEIRRRIAEQRSVLGST